MILDIAKALICKYISRLSLIVHFRLSGLLLLLRMIKRNRENKLNMALKVYYYVIDVKRNRYVNDLLSIQTLYKVARLLYKVLNWNNNNAYL